MEQLTRRWYGLLLVIGLILGLSVMSRGVEIGVEGGVRTGQLLEASQEALEAAQAELALGQTALALQRTSYAEEVLATERALQLVAQNLAPDQTFPTMPPTMSPPPPQALTPPLEATPLPTPPTVEEQAQLTATSLAAGWTGTELELHATAARATSYALQTVETLLQTQPPIDAAQAQTATAASGIATAVAATEVVIYTAWAVPGTGMAPTPTATAQP